MDELGIHLPSLVVYLVNFGVLTVALYLVGYKRILRMLDQRTERIKASLDEAERVKQDAAKAQEDMRKQLDESRQGVHQMMEQSRVAAERFREEELAKARVEGEAFLQRARQQIRQERDAAIEELRTGFADLAITAAERVVERSLDRRAHQDLIDQVLRESEQSGTANRS
ncbi:MAG: ATP synthase F0 subunit B [Dehalococcoidia bacterium]|nr:ATP synthase F0 subunit B [Dehalococcoidia bacterium]